MFTSEAVAGELSQLWQWRLVSGGLTDGGLAVVRAVQEDRLEDIAGHSRADGSHQTEGGLTGVPHPLLQLRHRQAKLCPGQTVGEEKGAVTLLGETQR